MVGIVAGTSFAPAVHALDLRDRVIKLDTSYVYESRKPGEAPYRNDQQTDDWANFFAVGGNLVSKPYAIHSDCDISLVYKPGQALSGKRECKPQRLGTPSNWVETSGFATYTTRMTVAGNLVNLRGEMTGVENWVGNHCGSPREGTKKFKIVQSLKIRIVGDQCEVLEYRQVADAELSSDAGPETTRFTYTLRQKRSCKIERLSDQPQEKIVPGGPFKC